MGAALLTDDLLLNQSLKTHRTFFQASWRQSTDKARRFADTDRSVARCFALPSGATIERVLRDEIRGLETLFDAWSDHAGLDTRRLCFRNTVTKRALYISPIIFLPDLLGEKTFRRSGSNTRIHMFRADAPENSVRLEAITTVTYSGLRFRYALSIQYERDAIGRPWQLLRPVILLDEAVIRDIHTFDDLNHEGPGLLTSLRMIIAQGMHDYVHGTVLRWFPPLAVPMPPAYLSQMFDQPPPAELKEWHRDADHPWPEGFCDETFSEDIEALELYSLLVHADNAKSIFAARPAVKARIADLAEQFFETLNAFAAWRSATAGRNATTSVDRYVSLVGLWFLGGLFPIGSPELIRIMERPDWFGVSRMGVVAQYGKIHGGFFGYINRVSRDAVPWGGKRVALNMVTRNYASGLASPSIRAHVTALFGGDHSVYGGYLERLRALGPETAAQVQAAAERLRAFQACGFDDDMPKASDAFVELQALRRSIAAHPSDGLEEDDVACVALDYVDSLAAHLAPAVMDGAALRRTEPVTV